MLNPKYCNCTSPIVTFTVPITAVANRVIMSGEEYIRMFGTDEEKRLLAQAIADREKEQRQYYQRYEKRRTK